MSKYDEALIEPGNPDNSQSVALELIGPDRRVLDVGCATGYLARALVAQGCTVVGIDNDAEAAEKARDTLERLIIVDLDATDLTTALGDDRFDAVVFGDVLEHLRDPSDVLRQARRLLTPGGSVVVSIPNVAHGDVAMALLQGSFRYTPLGLLDETHVRFYTYDSILALFARCGLLVVETRRIGKPLFATEIGVNADAISQEVVAAVRRSAESETYQFVMKALPDDLDGELAKLVARAREMEVRDLERDRRERESGDREAELGARVAQLEQSLADAEARIGATVDALALAAAERDVRTVEAVRASAEVRTMRSTRTFRWTAKARTAYGRLRALT